MRSRSSSHALADDLAQETFLAAYRNLRSFRQEARFSTWLYRIATNAFLAEARKRREELLGDRDGDLADDGDDDGRDAAPGSGDHARGAALHIDMERALAALSAAERAAIVQCYHNDLSHEEAAYVLGCPVGTVKTHILRGNDERLPRRRVARRLARRRARRRWPRASRRLRSRRRIHRARRRGAAAARRGPGVAPAGADRAVGELVAGIALLGSLALGGAAWALREE